MEKQLTKEQFGATVKKRYTQYKDMSDLEVAEKVLAKYPEYSSKISGVSEKESTVGSRVLESVKGSLTQAKEQITGEGTSASVSAPTRGFQLASTATGLPVKAAISALPESVQSGISKVGQAITTPIKWLGDKIGDIKGLQDLVTRNPQAAKVIEELAQIGQATSETGANIAVLQSGVVGAKGIASGVKQGGIKTAELAQKGANLVNKGIGSTKEFVSGVGDIVKPIISEIKTLPQKARINVAQAKATEATIKSLPKTGQTAVRSGVELSDVKSLYKLPKTQAAQKIVK
jgi:hypothetical protein